MHGKTFTAGKCRARPASAAILSVRCDARARQGGSSRIQVITSSGRNAALARLHPPRVAGTSGYYWFARRLSRRQLWQRRRPPRHAVRRPGRRSRHWHGWPGQVRASRIHVAGAGFESRARKGAPLLALPLLSTSPAWAGTLLAGPHARLATTGRPVPSTAYATMSTGKSYW